ncbi:integrin beta-PS-like [Limulus polyphemus]|uniref:Integrin beta n=1 Tax=Limulus polyphemus TaxID=6850 RepID=A0ABM1BHJ3_LIMPO|nr:integrin beta-PS-like [Limulus polyphemus]XP_013782119.1 integrin beta-PS-like [Limulus polyphemus]
MKYFTIGTVIILLQLSGICKTQGNQCNSKETCGKCIASDSACAWCRQENFESNYRCDLEVNLKGKCNESKIVKPENEIKKIKDEQLSNKGALEGEAVQINPQRVHLKLRPNMPFKLEIKCRQAVDYPVDLYYVMDLSKSMEDDKDKLASLGGLLAEEMGKITKNFRLGFGSFVDKIALPFVSTYPSKLKKPCYGCAAPYGFRNQLPLDQDTNLFAAEVKKANVSGNLDAPEGGFDAIMQAVVCQEQIGWRNKSRKLLVFSTDSGFHYAGDGKLAGIIKPNDEKCHLDDKGYYTETTTLDYPSFSQINRKIKEHKVNIIFAVTESQYEIYNKLSKKFEGSGVGKLDKDSANVVDLVRDQYNKITETMELKDNAPENVKITYYSSCLGPEGQLRKTSECKGIKLGDMITFHADIEVVSCPKNHNDWNRTIQIYPVGLNEALIIDLEIICECECQKPGKKELNSPKCTNGNGTYECGICNCYNGRTGRECECDSQNIDETLHEKQCYLDNSTEPCSGKGKCQCGTCICDTRLNPAEKIRGKYCECDNFSCDRVEGNICSGPDHGTCECGKCICLPGWKGSACECRDTEKTCYPPDSSGLCSGRGSCVCGKCECWTIDKKKYSGDYCEECINCPVSCDSLVKCVQCKMFQSGPLSQEECVRCNFTLEKVDEAEVINKNQKICVFTDDDECKFKFVYEANQDAVKVWAQTGKDCPEPVNVAAIVGGVIGGIVLIGLLLLLIWKILTSIHDRREYAKFEKERAMAKWHAGDNPLYKEATTTFKNPMYNVSKQGTEEPPSSD